MPFLPSNRTLFIPHKNKPKVQTKAKPPEAPVTHDNYQQDMQTLEVWARQPIQQLIAGSGITLTPSSGLATDATGQGPMPVEISASGGSGGMNFGLMEADIGPDNSNLVPGFCVFGFNNAISFVDAAMFPIYNPSSTNIPISGDQPSGSNWFVTASGGDSVNVLPTIDMPTWTGGGTISMECIICATDLTWTNYLFVQASHSFTTGQTYQFTAADFSTTLSSGGIDLTLTAGTGQSGNGLVSTAGGIYMAAVQLQVHVPTGQTFS